MEDHHLIVYGKDTCCSSSELKVVLSPIVNYSGIKNFQSVQDLLSHVTPVPPFKLIGKLIIEPVRETADNLSTGKFAAGEPAHPVADQNKSDISLLCFSVFNADTVLIHFFCNADIRFGGNYIFHLNYSCFSSFLYPVSAGEVEFLV